MPVMYMPAAEPASAFPEAYSNMFLSDGPSERTSLFTTTPLAGTYPSVAAYVVQNMDSLSFFSTAAPTA